MEGPTVARGEQLWQPYMVRGTIGGAVFGSAGPHAARTTYGVTDPLQSFWALVNHRLRLNNGYTDRSAKATKDDKKS